MKFLFQFSVRHHLQSDIKDVPGRPGRPFPNAAAQRHWRMWPRLGLERMAPQLGGLGGGGRHSCVGLVADGAADGWVFEWMAPQLGGFWGGWRRSWVGLVVDGAAVGLVWWWMAP